MERSEGNAATATRRLRFATANELFDAFPTARSDMRAVPTDQDSISFMRALQAGPTPEEAITFAAYLLPLREVVWWSHQCLSYIPEALTPLDHEMLGYAEAWVREPDEETRNAALTASTDADSESPGVWVAFAAGWSGGSMAPSESAPVPPPPYLTPRAVNAAVLSFLARIDNRHRADTLKGFVEMAVKLTEM